MENQKPAPITVGSQEGQHVSVVGDTYRILVTGKQTGNAFATIDMLYHQVVAPARMRTRILKKPFMSQMGK